LDQLRNFGWLIVISKCDEIVKRLLGGKRLWALQRLLGQTARSRDEALRQDVVQFRVSGRNRTQQSLSGLVISWTTR